MRLDDREMGAVLAALRYWQRAGGFAGDDINDIATGCGEFDELTDVEIDDLCERINVVEDDAQDGPSTTPPMTFADFRATKVSRVGVGVTWINGGVCARWDGRGYLFENIESGVVCVGGFETVEYAAYAHASLSGMLGPAQ